MVTLSPVGLAAAPVANQAAFLATFKEKQSSALAKLKIPSIEWKNS